MNLFDAIARIYDRAMDAIIAWLVRQDRRAPIRERDRDDDTYPPLWL